MAKQFDKAQLLSDIKTEHRRLENCLLELSQEDMLLPVAVGSWSIKDVLAHLTAWEQLLLGWYQAGLRNETPKLSPVGMSQIAIDQLNQRIYAEHELDSLEKVWAEFQNSYQQSVTMIVSMPEEDLLANKRFAWTGRLKLADYVVGNTSNHYRWAKTKIRQWMKARDK